MVYNKNKSWLAQFGFEIQKNNSGKPCGTMDFRHFSKINWNKIVYEYRMWSDLLKRAMQKTQVKYFDIKDFLKTTIRK